MVLVERSGRITVQDDDGVFVVGEDFRIPPTRQELTVMDEDDGFLLSKHDIVDVALSNVERLGGDDVHS